MKKIIIPNAPDPSEPQYRTNPLAYNRAVFDWMNKTKGRIEQASLQNDIPLDTPFVVTSFSTNTALTGTDTGTSLADFVCTLVQAMTDRGIITITTASS